MAEGTGWLCRPIATTGMVTVNRPVITAMEAVAVPRQSLQVSDQGKRVGSSTVTSVPPDS